MANTNQKGLVKKNVKPDDEITEPVIEQSNGSNLFIFPDGSQYDGGWVELNGIKVREGQGTFRIGPEEYIGTWTNDQMSGYGIYKFASGAVYDGEFSQNIFHGQGEYNFS